MQSVTAILRPIGLAAIFVSMLGGPGAYALAKDAAPPADGKVAPAKKKAKKKAASPATPSATAESAQAKRRRVGAEPAYIVGDSNPHFINERAPKIVAFPQDVKAVEKAFAETRRDQLVDAEKAARDQKSPDRWRTVLFSLRGLQDRSDPEACFWRVLAFYRLGEIDRARAVREGCELPAKDSSVLNTEDAAAAGVPAMGTVAREDQFTQAAATEPSKKEKASDKPAAPSVAAPPYTGPNPQRVQ